MVVVDGQGIPLGNLLDSASPAEVRLLEPTLDIIAVPRHGPGRPRKNPERVIYDKACDSDALRKRLAKRGIELICPHRKNRVKPPLQDGRKLRRYKRRWKVERTFRLAGEFPSPGGALGAPHHHVSSVLSCRVPADYLETVMKPLLV
jgi:transposase